MQLANCLVSLGGDHGNSVMKFAATAAEIAVLRAIHGEDAVNEIEPIGNVLRKHSEERGRLLAIYGAAKDPGQKPIVEGMFPGVAARVYEALDELDLDPSFFKSTGRMKAQPVATAPSDEEVMALVKARIAEDEAAEDADEGVGDDMPDASDFSDKPEENILG